MVCACERGRPASGAGRQDVTDNLRQLIISQSSRVCVRWLCVSSFKACAMLLPAETAVAATLELQPHARDVWGDSPMKSALMWCSSYEIFEHYRSWYNMQRKGRELDGKCRRPGLMRAL